jgi:hypothetical protein
MPYSFWTYAGRDPRYGMDEELKTELNPSIHQNKLIRTNSKHSDRRAVGSPFLLREFRICQRV